MHPRLVQDDVRHLGQPVLDILHPAGADQLRGVGGIGLPEGRLVHPVALFLDRVGEAEGLEHLHRAARDAVRLPFLKRAVAAFHDAGGDLGKGRKLGGERQPGRAAADDQHVHAVGQGRPALGHAGGGGLHPRVAGPETVTMILHEPLPRS